MSKETKFYDNFTELIIESGNGTSIVEYPAFKKLAEGEGYRSFCRKTLDKIVETKFEDQMEKVKKLLHLLRYICTTTDIWSSRGNIRSFLGLTAHGLTEKFERISVALACRRFEGTHSNERIKDLLVQLHGEFSLSTQKIISTITDNASNFAKAFREFGVQLEFDEEENEEDDVSIVAIEENLLPVHQRCASHTLNLLATTDFFNALKSNHILMHKFKRVRILLSLK